MGVCKPPPGGCHFRFLKNVSPVSVAFSQDTENPLGTSKTGMRLPWHCCLAFVP